MAPAGRIVKRKVARALGAGVVLLAASLGGAAQESFDYSSYARVLERAVTPDGRVRYAVLKENPAELKAFVGQLAAISPENRPALFPTRAAQMAYWINAYNAFVLNEVTANYPVESVRDLKFGFGFLFFKSARSVAGGKRYSLDDIEHNILRRRYRDPRIHFALNCASRSCPPLRREPFLPEKLEEQLEQATREFIARQENVWMRGDVLFLSAIFDWYKDDFVRATGPGGNGGEPPTVVDYVVGYLPPEVAAQVEKRRPPVEFYNYDWSLNDATPNSH
ncbi:MAG TPA: DUF547 domain-containing protein [Candidatus Xenobia bacterium]|nr:DUF547 domain-containing protein [Candidatus Xenobia bacterium]